MRSRLEIKNQIKKLLLSGTESDLNQVSVLHWVLEGQPTVIVAAHYLNSKLNPKDMGFDFANQIFTILNDQDNVVIDLRRLNSGLLISAFFNGFFSRLVVDLPSEKIHGIMWDVDSEWQIKNINRWAEDARIESQIAHGELDGELI